MICDNGGTLPIAIQLLDQNFAKIDHGSVTISRSVLLKVHLQSIGNPLFYYTGIVSPRSLRDGCYDSYVRKLKILKFSSGGYINLLSSLEKTPIY